MPETFPANDAPTTGQTTLDGLLAGLMNRAPGTVRVLLASGDGIKLAHTDKEQDKADEMAAVMAGLYSLGRGIFKKSPGGVRQVVVEHDGGRLFVMSGGGGATGPGVVGTILGVLALPSAEPGLVGYEMTTLIKGLNEHLITEARANKSSGQ
ncbi:roadblock/LC7 domain-containing protein [Streptomyces turgidiscabies]|uniref:roadblock/LC7 domain-containing protein n=1 Tax=Streptomyces turgidiscabies TaxID=85558 RepID=UPI0038F7FB1D